MAGKAASYRCVIGLIRTQPPAAGPREIEELLGPLMNIKFIAVVVGTVCGMRSNSCVRQFNFLNAKTTQLEATILRTWLSCGRSIDPLPHSRWRTPGHRRVGTNPHFEQQFSNCLSRQPHAFLFFGVRWSNNGGPAGRFRGPRFRKIPFFICETGPLSLDVAVFDPRPQLISENMSFGLLV